MLQFIFGRAASGKTTEMLARIRSLVTEGGEAVLLVPEQFSFDTEREVLHALGDHDAARVSVMSFTRLCDEVERLTGGGCGTVLADAQKLILLNRALRQSAPELRIWGRYTAFAGFTSALLDSIEEFKLNAVTPDQLLTAAERAQSASLRAKLTDLSTVYTRYNALIAERFIDPSDRLARLAARLLRFRYFEGKTVFLDSFKGFTGQQFAILDRILAQAAEVTVCMTFDPRAAAGFDLFSNIRKSVERIRALAAAHGVKQREDIFLEQQYFCGASIAAAEKLLSGQKGGETDDSVTVCRAATVYDEAEFAARTIRRLVRENPDYRFRDFVIIARDLAGYEEAVSAACEKNGVSCFFDRRVPLASCPPAAALLAALEAIRGYSSEQIFRFLKSGSGALRTDEISDLENYVNLWNIEGKQWFDDWNMNPDGFVTAEEDVPEHPSHTAELERLNQLRKRAVEPLYDFDRTLRGTAADFCHAVMGLFSACNTAQAMRELRGRMLAQNRVADADALRQSWDMLMELMNSFAECYGDSELDRAEFRETLKKAVGLSTIGVAPQMLDQVSFGAADRIRPARPRVAFILGANLGVFPKNAACAGLFGVAERKNLIALDIEIPDRGIAAAIDEDFLVYTNFCCASDRVYVSYCTANPKGESAEPSAFVSEIVRQLDCRVLSEPAALTAENLPESPDAAFSQGCLRYSSDLGEGMTIFSVLDALPGFGERIRAVLNGASRRTDVLSAQTAQRLYRTQINMSASRLDTYYRCKFRHFCRYGLRVKAPQPAEFNAGQRGLIVHYVLQRLIEKYHKDVAALSDAEILQAVDFFIGEYLESIPGYRSAETAYMRFLCENISRSTKEVALHLKREFAQSDFEPKYCEFRFGASDDEPIEIPFDGGSLRLNGLIDRVDIYNGYIRIVDYKTGSRSFKLSDIVVGQNLQMLMYLYAILQKKDFSDLRPAGILYMPAKREKREENTLRMNGLLAADEALVCAMEEKNAGEFVPRYRQTADGRIDRKCAASFVPQEGFQTIFDFIEETLKKTGEGILGGQIAVDPTDGLGSGSAACAYCDFAAVCRIEDEPANRAAAYTNEQVLELISEKGERHELSGNAGAAEGD